ncbi:nuclear transcription factor Y subunit C-1-like [Impatiens glandulifera]|uniref:nuclear transcription factor Y subunit C-1-like n=1 Tax=Impatiens glandulifera TaxID=253017 RepID=UPI001FB1798C|nr:nuclear transcription factor Y subunit C-1-like [Impatiens glandulifera]
MKQNQQLNQHHQQLSQQHHQPQQQQHHQPQQQQHHQPPQTGMPPPLMPYPTHNPYHHILQHQKQQLQRFWNLQRQEIEQTTDFKTHKLPLARIKKIMKADEDVRMISAEAPVLFSKACEMFILDQLTYRSWLHAEENKRLTLQKNDITAAMTRSDIFDFLVDIVPREENRDGGTHGIGGIMSVVGSSSSVPYDYPHMGQDQQPQTSVMMGRSSMPTMQTLPPLPPMQTMPTMPTMPMVDPGMYAQPPSQAWQSVWQTGVDDGPYGDCGNMGPDLDDGHGHGHAYVFSFSLL